MRVFVRGCLSSQEEFISISGHFLVAVYMILSRDNFIPVLSTKIKRHPGMKRGEKCHVNGLPG